MSVPDILNLNEKCTGCAACVSVCPAGCLELRYDKDGFFHPALTDSAKCRDCGLCAKNCAVLHPIDNLPAFEEGTYYSYQAYEEDVLKNSSSGGFFTLLAENVLRENGIVFGCAFDYRKGIPVYTDTDHVSLNELRKSKYAESRTGKIFGEVRKQLHADRAVLFCGTPCHVQGLRKYLGKDFENPKLLTMDFICYGVPSSRNFHDYAGTGLTSVDFRYKDFSRNDRGWKDYCLKLQYGTKKVVYSSVYYSPFMIAFGVYMGLRSSCYSCNRVLQSAADFTIGDFWGLSKLHPEEKDNRGCSVIVIHSERGKNLWSDVSPEKSGKVEKLPLSAVQYFLHDRTFTGKQRCRERLFRLAVRLFTFVPAVTLFLPKAVIGRSLKKTLKGWKENQ